MKKINHQNIKFGVTIHQYSYLQNSIGYFNTGNIYQLFLFCPFSANASPLIPYYKSAHYPRSKFFNN